MSLEVDLYTLLSTDASMLAAMNARPNVWLGMIPKGEDDNLAVVIQTVIGQYETAEESINAWTKKRMQFDSYGEKYSETLFLSNTVRDLLKNLKGSLANTNVQGTIVMTDRDMPYEAGESGYVFRRLLEIDFVHTDGSGSIPYTPANPPAGGSNAAFLQNLPISQTVPTNGQALLYSSANNDWEPGTPGSGPGLNFADEETPSGTIDGVNGTFTLLHTPNPAASALLVKNVSVLTQGIAYTISGNTITYLSGYIPQPASGSDPADTHRIWYRY